MTIKQEEILNYMFDYQVKNGSLPSIRVIANDLGKSSGTIQKHIDLITKKGYLKKDNRKILYTDLGREYYKKIYEKWLREELEKL